MLGRRKILRLYYNTKVCCLRIRFNERQKSDLAE